MFLRLDSGLRSTEGSIVFIKSGSHITYVKKNNTAGLLRENKMVKETHFFPR